MAGETLQAAIRAAADSVAIIVPAHATAGGPAQPQPLTVTYRDLASQVASFRRKLAAVGVGCGAAVSIATPNSYEFVVAFLAAAGRRAVAAPLNPAYTQPEFEFYIADLRSVIVLVPRGACGGDSADADADADASSSSSSSSSPAVRAARKFGAAVAECYWDGARGEVVLDIKHPGRLPAARRKPAQPKDAEAEAEEEEAEPGDTALVLHTSGTTSRPKVVPLSHRNLTRTMANIVRTYALTPADRTMLVMPLFHVHGLLCGLLASLASGGSVVLPPRFSASDFWRDFAEHGATWYTAVPTMHQILLRHPKPDPLPRIRFIRSCSSPLPPTVFHQLESAYGAPVLEAYAMTEAAHQMTSSPLPPARRKPGSVGLGQGVEVAVVDAAGARLPPGAEGEIAVRGDNVTAGYLNNEAANAAAFTRDGLFRTGDQGRLDADGYLTITGRIKELINKGGEKIAPVEIDNALAHHPAVAEAVSFAVPDHLYGQDVAVAVVVKPGAARPTPDDLRRWVAEKLAKFKVPKKIYFTDIMPKTATGKVQRRLVAEEMQKQDLKAKL